MVALAVASFESVAGAQNTTKATYPMLADPEHQVAGAYGVYGLLGDKYAAPSVFIIGADGRIVWNYVGESSNDRPDAQTILEHLP